jgi:cytochrome b6
MNIIPRRLWIFGVVALVAFLAFLPLASSSQTHDPEVFTTAKLAPPVVHKLMSTLASDEHVMGAIGQDQCLHCHLAGEITEVQTPTMRWLVYGGAGLLFAFGMYRTTSVWGSRKRWRPFSHRAADWLDDRLDVKEPWADIAGKPVPKFARQWFYCLGGITALLFAIQGLTGILLAFYYKPTAAEAYASIQFIENEVYFGAAVRALHHWAANGTIIMCIAHMIRVFLTGAYKAPRELNWVAGTVLLLVTMGFGLTGYLLPWDQTAFWATTVATDIAGGIPDAGPLALVIARGGWTVTGATLGRFFAVHTLVLPTVTVIFMGLHFLMIRRQGIARPL